MTDIVDNRAQKTQTQIENIKSRLSAHRKNIKLLHSFYMGGELFNGNNVSLPVVKYGSIQKCEKRYRWTVKNLTDQIASLELELALLMEYGA